ncbi:MAG: sugar phosphate nucleotidyltransferase, partial [Pseudoxanthomonas sp.]
VMNGDILTDVHYGEFLDEHVDEDRLFTISAAARNQRIDYGVLKTTDSNTLCGFEEKPSIPFLVSMGVYAVSRRVLDVIPVDQAFGFDDLVLGFLAKGDSVVTVPHDGYWLDIGRPDDYERAIDDWPELSKRLALG